jgi:hypothetical protein
VETDAETKERQTERNEWEMEEKDLREQNETSARAIQ